LPSPPVGRRPRRAKRVRDEGQALNRPTRTPHPAVASLTSALSPWGRGFTTTRLRRGVVLTTAALAAVWGLYAQLFSVSLIYEEGRQARSELVFRPALKAKRATPPAQAPQRTESTAVPADGETPAPRQLEASLLGSAELARQPAPLVCDVPVFCGVAWPEIHAPPDQLAPPTYPSSITHALWPYSHGPPAAA